MVGNCDCVTVYTVAMDGTILLSTLWIQSHLWYILFNLILGTRFLEVSLSDTTYAGDVMCDLNTTELSYSCLFSFCEDN